MRDEEDPIIGPNMEGPILSFPPDSLKSREHGNIVKIKVWWKLTKFVSWTF